MKYVIFEDEQFAMQRLQLIIERLHPDYHLAHSGTTVADAIAYFQHEPDADIVFMDIELADGNCFDIFNEVNVNTPIIFTTAYDEYMMKAFKVNSIDYLLKPISETDLALALAKFERLRPESGMRTDYHALQETVNQNHTRIRLISGDNFLFADISEIAFFISEDNYVYAYLNNGKRRLTNFSNMAETAAALPASDFYQLSRNIITSISSIKSVSRFFRGRLLVKLAAGTTVQECTVSSSRREDFLNWLGK